MEIKQMKFRFSVLLDGINSAISLIGLEDKKRELSSLEEMISSADFWQDKDKANSVMQKIKGLKRLIERWDKIILLSKDLEELLNLAEEDESIIGEVEKELLELEEMYNQMERELLFRGRFDENDAIVEIQAGAGGTESCDWANMLYRMYCRWAERKGFEVRVIHKVVGEEAGIKSISMLVSGMYAYGHLKAERGVHRLVRISPFDANKRRHTSFASIDVAPQIDEDIDIELHPQDLRIDVFRSTGPGGQSVNTTDSAVRIVHIPTGIVVTCRNERSQLQNKQTALKILKARLYELEEQKRQRELEKEVGEKKKIEWGSQIRSYILQPYRLVKDHRTGYERSDVENVLDGDIDDFIFAYLRFSSGGKIE